MGPVDAAARNLRLTEALALQHIPEDGLRFDEALPIEFLNALVAEDPSLDLRAIAEGRGVIEVMPVGAVTGRPPVVVRGTLSAPLQSSCVRCLEDVDIRIEVKLETTLFPSTGTAEEQADQDLDLEALLAQADEGTYDESQGLDLPALIRETILLELEMNPVCQETTACDTRTAALLSQANAGTIAALGEGDPRWAALRALVPPGEGDA